MSHPVRVLCRPAVAPGFWLTGLTVVEASDGASASVPLLDWAHREGTGVVLIDDALHRDLPDDIVRQLNRRPLPVLVPIPAPDWHERSAPDEYIVEMLRRAIGYRVKIR